MKTTLLSICFTMLLAVTGCKKEPDVDPREQYIGQYSISVTAAAKYDGKLTGTNVDRYTLKVEKGSGQTDLKFTDFLGSYSATLTDNKFEVPVFNFVQASNGNYVTLRTIGHGVFSPNAVDLNYTGVTYKDYKTTQIDWIGKGIKN